MNKVANSKCGKIKTDTMVHLVLFILVCSVLAFFFLYKPNKNEYAMISNVKHKKTY
jgi:hypothetical protein